MRCDGVCSTVIGIVLVGFVAVVLYSRFGKNDGKIASIKIIPSEQQWSRKGVVEYVRFGRGPVVLVLHGAPGGIHVSVAFLQRLLFGSEWRLLGSKSRMHKSEYTFLVVSRPGYSKTRLGRVTSLAEEVELLVDFLDDIEVDQFAIFGLLAGSQIAYSFVEAYPQRCWGMVIFGEPIETPQFSFLGINLTPLVSLENWKEWWCQLLKRVILSREELEYFANHPKVDEELFLTFVLDSDVYRTDEGYSNDKKVLLNENGEAGITRSHDPSRIQANILFIKSEVKGSFVLSVRKVARKIAKFLEKESEFVTF